MAKMYAGSDAALTMGLIMGAHLVSDGYLKVSCLHCSGTLSLLLLTRLDHDPSQKASFQSKRHVTVSQQRN